MLIDILLMAVGFALLFVNLWPVVVLGGAFLVVGVIGLIFTWAADAEDGSRKFLVVLTYVGAAMAIAADGYVIILGIVLGIIGFLGVMFNWPGKLNELGQRKQP